MSVLVPDLPSLDWIKDVPAHLSVRLAGTTSDCIHVVFWDARHEVSVACPLEPWESPNLANVVEAIQAEVIRKGVGAMVPRLVQGSRLVN